MKILEVSLNTFQVSLIPFPLLISWDQGLMWWHDQCLVFLSRSRSERWHEVRSKEHKTNIKEYLLGERWYQETQAKWTGRWELKREGI